MNYKKRYFDNLDASRFIAFIIVFLAHAFVANSIEIKNSNSFQFIYHWGKLGILGLEYFFVLSSFLISWIILEEKSHSGQFNIKHFLIRRSLRVWPLYFLIVLMGFAVSGVFYYNNITISEIPSWYNFVLFIVNFYVIENGTNFLFFLVFLWSISIEEQFYLFYSVILKYLKINLLYISIVLIIASLVFRFLYINDGDRLFFHTISALGNFGVGGIAAYIAFHRKPLFIHLIGRKKIFNLFFYLLLILSIVFYHQLNDFKLFTVFSRIYFSLLFAYYIIEQAFGKHRLFNPGKNKLLNHLGKISYGLYCFHGVVITVLIKSLGFFNYTETHWHSYLIYPLIILITTIVIAHISFTYYENYFLKLKNKFYTFTSN